jgi:hypothetical protein
VDRSLVRDRQRFSSWDKGEAGLALHRVSRGCAEGGSPRRTRMSMDGSMEKIR